MDNKYHYHNLIINGKQVDLNDGIITEVFNKLDYELIAKVWVFNSHQLAILNKKSFNPKKHTKDYGTYCFEYIGNLIDMPQESFILEAINEIYNDINYQYIIDFLLANYNNLLETSNQSRFMSEVNKMLRELRIKIIEIFNNEEK